MAVASASALVPKGGARHLFEVSTTEAFGPGAKDSIVGIVRECTNDPGAFVFNDVGQRGVKYFLSIVAMVVEKTLKIVRKEVASKIRKSLHLHCDVKAKDVILVPTHMSTLSVSISSSSVPSPVVPLGRDNWPEVFNIRLQRLGEFNPRLAVEVHRAAEHLQSLSMKIRSLSFGLSDGEDPEPNPIDTANIFLCDIVDAFVIMTGESGPLYHFSGEAYNVLFDVGAAVSGKFKSVVA